MKQNNVRPQTTGEEWANAIVHAIACILIVVVTLLTWPLARSGASQVTAAAAAIYLSTMLFLYAASALYHVLPPGRAKQLFMKMDYCAIYLFIAGSYTPFGSGLLSGHGGTTLLIVMWTLAAVGVALQVIGKQLHPLVGTGFYLAMGWAVLALVQPLFRLLPMPGLIWLLAGSFCYTSGVLFFLMDSQLKFAHSVWHVFVLAGSACQFVAITWYA